MLLVIVVLGKLASNCSSPYARPSHLISRCYLVARRTSNTEGRLFIPHLHLSATRHHHQLSTLSSYRRLPQELSCSQALLHSSSRISYITTRCTLLTTQARHLSPSTCIPLFFSFRSVCVQLLRTLIQPRSRIVYPQKHANIFLYTMLAPSQPLNNPSQSPRVAQSACAFYFLILYLIYTQCIL